MRFRIECDLPFSRTDFWRLRAAPSFLEFIVTDGLLKKMEATPTEYDADGWASRRQHYCPVRVDCPDFIRAAIGDTMFEVDDEQRWHDDLAPFEQQYRIRPSFLRGLSRTSGTLTVSPHPDDDDAEKDVIEEPISSEDDLSVESDLSVAMRDSSVSGSSPSSSSSSMDLRSASESEPRALSSEPDGDRTVGDSSTDPETSDSCDSDSSKGPLDADSFLALLRPSEKSRHIVSGDTRVSILTLGWFVERAIVHNLRTFYKSYPATIIRFRQKLYNDFADGDLSVPCSVVVDRFLEREDALEREAAEAAAERDAAAEREQYGDLPENSIKVGQIEQIELEEEVVEEMPLWDD